MESGVADLRGAGGGYRDPLWRVTVELTALELLIEHPLQIPSDSGFSSTPSGIKLIAAVATRSLRAHGLSTDERAEHRLITAQVLAAQPLTAPLDSPPM